MPSTTTQRGGTQAARDALWDVIDWFEATNGTGSMPERIYLAAVNAAPCRECGGTGRLADHPCPRCQPDISREDAADLLGALGCEVKP